MKGTVKTIDIADALRLTRKSVLERAKKEHWMCAQHGNALVWLENRLPMDVRFALQCRPEESVSGASEKNRTDIRQEAYTNANDKARATANWRSSLLFRYRSSGMNVHDFCESYNRGEIDSLLFAKLGTVSVPTLYRWLHDFNADGASGVIPKYGMNRGGAGASLTDIEKDLLRHFWLRSTKPSVQHALILMKENIPFSVCTYQTANRYLHQIPDVIATYYREGPSRFENMCLPYMEQDVSLYRSLDCVVSDHHCLDCVCMYHGKLIRPWLTTMQDYRSGKVLGWCVCVKPSSLSIIVAYYLTVIQYGIPKTLLFDNGKDYHSKLLNGHTDAIKVCMPDDMDTEQEVEFTGVFHNIGSDVHFTRVYNGKSKGRQERYFRVIGELVAKDFGTYVGSDSRSRPEEAQLMWRGINGMEQRHDIPDFSEFVKTANATIQYINDRITCTGKGMDGHTRSDVFAAHLPPETEIRHATKEMLQAALCTGEVRKCGRNGIRINGTSYYSPELIEVVGQDVIVRSSLVIDNEVQVFRANGEFLCTAYGDYFKETGALDADIEKLSAARKKSLAYIAEQGTNEVQAAPEYETMHDVALGIYGKKELPDIDEALELPKAAGQTGPVYGNGNGGNIQRAEGTAPDAKSDLKDPFLTLDDDWISK